MDARTRRIAAQVAVEAIADNPDGYDAATIDAVRAVARDAGVAALYVDMLPSPAHDHGYRSDISDWWCYTCRTVTDYCQQTNPHD